MVEHSVFQIATTEEETLIRQKLVWEDDAASTPEMTNAGMIASNLMGTPASGTDNFVVHQREVTFVSFVTSTVTRNTKKLLEKGSNVNGLFMRISSGTKGETTPVDDDMGVDDFGVPKPVRRPLSRPSSKPPNYFQELIFR